MVIPTAVSTKVVEDEVYEIIDRTANKEKHKCNMTLLTCQSAGRFSALADAVA